MAKLLRRCVGYRLERVSMAPFVNWVLCPVGVLAQVLASLLALVRACAFCNSSSARNLYRALFLARF